MSNSNKHSVVKAPKKVEIKLESTEELKKKLLKAGGVRDLNFLCT